jgi:hypothetical protein
MNVALLSRKPVEISLEQLDRSIAQQAYSNLQYYRPTKVVKQEQQKQELLKVLKDLDIQPFEEHSVQRYMNRVQYGNWELKCFTALALVSAFAYSLFPIQHPLGEIGCAAGVLATLAAVAIHFGPTLGNWRWKRIENYEGVIPTFALSTALRIKERLRDAEFHVNEFITARERREELIAADPFLAVSYGGLTLYVEVWDEPDFNATRKA